LLKIWLLPSKWSRPRVLLRSDFVALGRVTKSSTSFPKEALLIFFRSIASCNLVFLIFHSSPKESLVESSMADQPTEETSKEPEQIPADSSEGQPPAVESEPTPATTVPEPKTEPQSTSPAWPDLAADHPLSKLSADLPAILEDAGYDEVYGLKLSDATSFHTKLILQKFLRANTNDLGKAKEQLLGTLKWRKEFQPLKAVEEQHSKDKFGGLGYVTVLSGVPGSSNEKDVVTFNIYGAVKDNQKTFGDIERLVTSFVLAPFQAC
jgi:hypothetical protein